MSDWWAGFGPDWRDRTPEEIASDLEFERSGMRWAAVVLAALAIATIAWVFA